jgi:hypothetical protein
MNPLLFTLLMSTGLCVVLTGAGRLVCGLVICGQSAVITAGLVTLGLAISALSLIDRLMLRS